MSLSDPGRSEEEKENETERMFGQKHCSDFTVV